MDKLTVKELFELVKTKESNEEVYNIISQIINRLKEQFTFWNDNSKMEKEDIICIQNAYINMFEEKLDMKDMIVKNMIQEFIDSLL